MYFHSFDTPAIPLNFHPDVFCKSAYMPLLEWDLATEQVTPKLVRHVLQLEIQHLLACVHIIAYLLIRFYDSVSQIEQFQPGSSCSWSTYISFLGDQIMKLTLLLLPKLYYLKWDGNINVNLTLYPWTMVQIERITHSTYARLVYIYLFCSKESTTLIPNEFNKEKQQAVLDFETCIVFWAPFFFLVLSSLHKPVLCSSSLPAKKIQYMWSSDRPLILACSDLNWSSESPTIPTWSNVLNPGVRARDRSRRHGLQQRLGSFVSHHGGTVPSSSN
jgi:hypothetical protein